jgi:hypothetical protein
VGHVAIGVEKQVLDVVSQQFIPPFVTAGQLVWQSLSVVHDEAHMVPPPPDELLPEEAVLPDEEPLGPPLSSLTAVAS